MDTSAVASALGAKSLTSAPNQVVGWDGIVEINQVLAPNLRIESAWFDHSNEKQLAMINPISNDPIKNEIAKSGLAYVSVSDCTFACSKLDSNEPVTC